MINTNSPLESLAAFAIAFTAGVASTVALKIYASWIKSRATKV